MAAALHVVESGDRAASTVVLVHGTMDRSSSFGRVARQLGDLHLLRYDRRGYARSYDAGIGALADHVADLLTVIEGAEGPVVAFGHSFGGVVALTAASQAPDTFGCVVAYESPTPWASWWPARAAGSDAPLDPAEEAEAFMRRAIGDRIWERLPARSRSDRRAEGAALLADLDAVHAGVPYLASDLTVPVISSYGSETTWWHRRASEELADAAPDGELVVVGGAAHGVHLTHPTATAALVRRGVERCEGLAARR
ncbi:MAG: alpha/beta fold hydrolase [Acidimicrobiales bacterium]|nr:alpha/beta fold hydrolase [Acidimicrobiales bacterium]